MPLLVSLLAPASAEPFLVGHRGLPSEAPENTLPSFKLAWENGADAIEGDFHLTNDGVIVCSHDANTRRTSGIDLVIKDHSFEELRKIDQGAKYSTKFSGTLTPTLAEVLATIPKGKKIFIEIKVGAEIVDPMSKVLKRSGLEDSQIVFISFQKAPLKVLKERHPQWKTYWLTSYDKESPLKPSVEEIIGTLKQLKADGLDSQADPRIDAAFIETIHAAGFECHFWTVDDPATARKLLDWGADSITTNRAGKLRKELAR